MIMIKNNKSSYSDLDSFDDLHLERMRLILKSRLLETRINMNLTGIRETFSFSGLAFSIVKENILPKISDLLGFLNMKGEKKADLE
jgi:hypothetical protein